MPLEAGQILIVDDDAEVLLAAELVLKRHFARVVTACTPASIELLLQQHAIRRHPAGHEFHRRAPPRARKACTG